MKANLLRNKTVIITDGDSELSSNLAIELALLKCEVILIGKNKDKLTKTSKYLEENKKKGGRINPVVALWKNVSDIEKTVMAVKKLSSSLDILVYSSIEPFYKKFDDLTNNDIEALLNNDLKFEMIFLKYILKEIRNAKKPMLVTINDFMSMVGVPYFSLYNMKQFALNGFFESLRRELIGERLKFLNVRVSMNREKFSEDSIKKFEKLGYSFINVQKVVKVIVEAMNDEKKFLELDKGEKNIIFSNKLFNASVDNKFKETKNKILNALV